MALSMRVAASSHANWNLGDLEDSTDWEAQLIQLEYNEPSPRVGSLEQTESACR